MMAPAHAAPAAPPAEVQSVDLHWIPLAPTWALVLAGGVMAAALGLGAWSAVRRGPQPSPRLRWAAAACRALGSAALLLALCGPNFEVRRGTPAAREVVVVVDNSRSMARPAADYPDGAAAAAAVQARLATDGEPVPRVFGNLHGPCAPTEAAGGAGCGAPTGGSSPLVEAVERAVLRRGLAVAAVVLVSDGMGTGLDTGLPSEDASDAAFLLSDELRRRLQALEVPVSTVATGSRGAFDLRLAEVSLDPVVFVKTTVQLDCAVALHGTPPGPIVVELWHNGALQAERTLPPPANTKTAPKVLHAQFALRAETVGEQVYACRVRPQPGERNLLNNVRAAVLRPLRDKVRVLHVAGRPSFDERFLRQALKDDRNVEVVSFFILRTPYSDGNVPERELSLIPFPVARLFTEELRNFDAVVLQNFDFRPYAMAQYLGNLQQAVREQGLGLVLLGGEEGFAEGGYGGTPLEDVLPLALQPATDRVRPTFADRAVPTLTAAGRHHPLLALAPTQAERARLMRLLPAVEGLNALGAPTAGAQVLLEANVGGPAGGSWPLLAARDVGRGRTIALATDGAWRWAYAPTGPEDSPRAYAQLWRNAWRWLTHDPEFGRLRLLLAHHERVADAAASVGGPDEQDADTGLLGGEVRVLGADWQPDTLTGLRVWATPHPTAPHPGVVPANAESAAFVVTPRADADGRAAFRLGPLPAGVWQVCAERGATPPRPAGPEAADEPALAAERACTAVVVHPAAEEVVDADGDGWLAEVARATGGAAKSARQVARAGLRPPLGPPPPMQVTAREQRPLAGHPALLTTILVGYGLAFLLGRRAGGR